MRFHPPQFSQAVFGSFSSLQRLQTNILFLPKDDTYNTKGEPHLSQETVLPQSLHSVIVARPFRSENTKTFCFFSRVFFISSTVES